MKKTKSFILLFLISVIILSCLTGCSSSDYARITDMDYRAVLVDEPGSEGKIVVTERITFDVHAASAYNGFWELWRDLCEDNVDGVPVYYRVKSVKQILPDGKEIVWPESPRLYWEDEDYEPWNNTLGPGKWFYSPGPYNEDARRYEAIFFYINNVYREKMTFEIEYEMYNAALRYGDCSDLYISLYSGNTTRYLKSLDAEFLIPNKDMPSEGNYKVTTYGTNNRSFPIEESKTKHEGYHTFSFNLTEEDLKFKPYNEYVEFDLVSYGEDKHKFTDYASKNDYYYDDVLDEVWSEQAWYQNSPKLFFVVKVVILLACLAAAFLIVYKNKKKLANWDDRFPFYSEDNVNSMFRDIPSDLDPQFAAELVFCKDKKKKDLEEGVYSSILLSLARKKYIDLEEDALGEVKIIIKELEAPQLSPELAEQIATFTDGESVLSTSETDDVEPPELIVESEVLEATDVIEETSTVEIVEPIQPVIIDTREPLTVTEEFYLSLIKRHAPGNEVTMDNLQSRISSDYDYVNRFVKNMKKSVVDVGVGQGYFQKANYLEPKYKLLASARNLNAFGFLFLLVNLFAPKTPISFAFGGFFIVAIACFVMGHYLKSQAHRYVLLTEFGEQEYIKWRGLYNFLDSETLIHERTVVELPLWERYLVYATAFGISEKVIAAIKLRCPEAVAASDSIVTNRYCRSTRIRTHSRSFHSSVRRGSAGVSYRGSSGGFGYGGGGRGGGGGGGGH